MLFHHSDGAGGKILNVVVLNLERGGCGHGMIYHEAAVQALFGLSSRYFTSVPLGKGGVRKNNVPSMWERILRPAKFLEVLKKSRKVASWA